MEVGEELRLWLTDENKPYTARLEFAIKVWQSLDFVYFNKHEVVCQWLSNALNVYEELPVAQLQQIFSLRAQPGLVSVATKSSLIKRLLKRVMVASPDAHDAKELPQLLQSLLNFELVQDALRADYNLLMETYGVLFTKYERQVLLTDNNSETQTRHADFIMPLLQQLHDYVQRAQKPEQLLSAYTKKALQPLCQLVLRLREHGFCCFEQFAALEMQLTGHLTSDDMETIKSFVEHPMHVLLLKVECALVNHRYETAKFTKLLKQIMVWEELEIDKEGTSMKPKWKLQLVTHTLHALRKHNIQLNSIEGLDQTGINDMAENIYSIVNKLRKDHLHQVLQMLCAALRFNPLLIEPHVYQLTIWMMCSTKSNDLELSLYGEYLVLLLDMCRRMSRTERFVMQLLKSLREWLHLYKIPVQVSGESSKRSRQTLEEAPTSEEQEHEQNPEVGIYVEMIFKADDAQTNVVNCGSDPLAQTWPSQTVGIAFTRLVSQLMSKPSIVIWKCLLHSFAELLEPNTQAVLPENLNFAIELQATLLSEYLLGTRLAEHVQQHYAEVEKQRQHTVQVMQQFGRYLLTREHNRRMMNLFLECVERAIGLDLLLAYYWPDGFATLQSPPEQPQLQRFLSGDEWELIQQRVHNFGKTLCRQRLQRLELLLVQSGWLLLPNQRHVPCPDALVEYLPQQLFGHLTRKQKEFRVQQQSQQQANLLEDAECVELLTLQLLQQFADSLKQSKIKGAQLGKLLPLAEHSEKLSQSLREQCASTKQPALPAESTQELVDALQQLPLAQLQNSIKLRLWLLIFTLYQDVRRAQLVELAKKLLDQLIDLMHFGQPLPLCSHFPQLEELLQLVPLSDDTDVTQDSITWRFYQTLFGRCVRRLTSGSDTFLTSCATAFREQLPQLTSAYRSLLLLAIETLASTTGVQAKRMQRHLHPLLEIFGQFVTHKFRSHKKSPAVYKDFVQQTLSGYSIYLNNCINRVNKQQQQQQQHKKDQLPEKDQNEDSEQKQEKEEHVEKSQPVSTPYAVQPIDENFRRICKIYIGHSLNYRNPHAISLLNGALTHRILLHLDQDEIEFVLDTYWRQLNSDIAASTVLDMTSIETAVKLIIGYKTNEDFLLLLRRLGQQLDEMQPPETEAQNTSLQNVLVLIVLFAKCSLSSIKGAMLNEHFELISGNVSLRLPPLTDAAYAGHVLRLLEAQRALAGNRTIPLTGETLDSILASMLDLNIKRFILAGGSWSDFRQIHAMLAENCLLLVKQHSTLMSDRAAQLTAICQDLVQSIVCYRSERKKAQSLTDEELNGLSELALKLVTLMAGIASGSQALAMKRVAPFLLIFTIKLMIATDRPTTLFEKVKVNLDRFCHELISMCDHRSGHFILRCSSDAGARLYQNLMKEHEKYHKFRGKV